MENATKQDVKASITPAQYLPTEVICEGKIISQNLSSLNLTEDWLMKKLKTGDTLVIKSIDRLGRNYDEILEQWRIITKEKQVAIVVLDMPLLDTRQSRDLTGTLIADIVLQLLSYVAQTEREFIRQRQAEGIAVAKKQGVKFGRKPMERPAAFPDLKTQWQNNMISARAAAKQLGITHNTFLRWANEKSGQKNTDC